MDYLKTVSGCISSIDELIVLAEKKVELLKKHRKGLIQHLESVDRKGGVPEARMREPCGGGGNGPAMKKKV